MYNYEEILAQLKNGANADDIANSFIEALNKAQKEYDDQAVVDAAQAAKIADTSSLLELITDYLAKYYPNIKFSGAETPEDFIALMDSVAQIQTTFSAAMKEMAEQPKFKSHKHRKSKDPIEEFLTSFGF